MLVTKLLIILTIIALATFLGWFLWGYLTRSSKNINDIDSYISQQLKYQSAFFAVAVLVVWCSYQISGYVFGIGNLSAEINSYGYLTKFKSITWLHIAPLLILIFLISSYFLVARSLSKVGNWRLFLKKYGIWIVILASLNSFSEELIYRGSLITVMEGDFPHWFIAIISGIVFMLAHIKGQVKGLFVLLGSAFIGWCLAYVVLQTQGLFWAWAIHFIQDLLIFSAFLVNTKQSKSSVVQPS